MPDSTLPAFDYALLRQHIGAARARFDVDWLDNCASTNTTLLERASLGAASGTVLGTDSQTAGRGRRGRVWLSSPGNCLTFSMLWRLPPQASTHGLSLAVGLAIAQALEALGAPAIQLKWPNDVWLLGRKLAGVLIEVANTPSGPGMVIGIGLNMRHDAALQPHIGQPSAALTDAGIDLPREAVLGAILAGLAEVLDRFGRDGFSCMREDWCARNAFAGQAVTISTERGTQTGTCHSVDADGALILIQRDNTPLQINHGDVSLIPLKR